MFCDIGLKFYQNAFFNNISFDHPEISRQNSKEYLQTASLNKYGCLQY